MKIFQYINYFFYLGWNWNPVLASFMIYHEIRGEKKYRLHTTGYDELKSLSKHGIDITHAIMYMPANYFILEKLLAKIKVRAGNNCLLDIGCGKGRVLAVAAHYGFKKIIGVEFSKKFCEETKMNLLAAEKDFSNSSFDIINQDASVYIIPDEVTTVFLYNPFDAEIMNHVVNHITDSLQRKPRNIYIIYLNPQEKHLFIQAGFTEIFHYKKLKYLEGIILIKKIE